jgi:hypothetical protein
MSYTLIPYLVDLEALRRAAGSKDEALIAAAAEREPGLFEPENADEDEIPEGEALRHLVMGTPPDKRSTHQYGYALKSLCEHLGERLDADYWESIHWDVLEATGMEEILTRTGSPVPLPPIDSFPAIGHLKAADIAAMVAKLGDGHLKTAAPSGRKPRRSLRAWLLGLLLSRFSRREPLSEGDLRELLDEYESWLRQAAAKQKSLVFFYH